MTMYDIPRG